MQAEFFNYVKKKSESNEIEAFARVILFLVLFSLHLHIGISQLENEYITKNILLFQL
jgi:succinate dehydrogenase hydrophobic anchor subunit